MILIINTAGAGIDLLLNGVFRHIDAGKQAVALPDGVEKLLNDTNVKWSDLRAVGVVVGPGSFTGIRLGIAYTKGVAIGLNIPVIPVNAFELYLESAPDAFVAIDSGRTDLFVGAADMEPRTMEITEIETFQMKYTRTVGHNPFDLHDAVAIIERKLATNANEPVVPMYLRPSYAELAQGHK